MASAVVNTANTVGELCEAANQQSLITLLSSDFLSHCRTTDLDQAAFVRFIQSGKGDIGHITKGGQTALILACSMEYSIIAMAILKYGTLAHPQQVSKTGNTALIWACRNGLMEVALTLLKYECRRNHVNKRGKTALDYAIKYGMDAVVEILKTTSGSQGSDTAVPTDGDDISLKIQDLVNRLTICDDVPKPMVKRVCLDIAVVVQPAWWEELD
jgi:hypothetical protein